MISNNEKKTILITGATGFIGQHLLQGIDQNAYNIKLITRKNPNKLKDLYPQFDVYEADLNNINQLMDACKGVEVIVNTAAEVRNIAQLATTNIGGTENLIKVIAHHKIPKVIHLSSVGVAGYQYSAKNIIVNEESECHPKNEYERTKLISEQLLLEAQKQHQFQLDIIRPTNVFGEGHPFNAILGLIKHVKNGKPFIYAQHAQVNYIYVKDLTALIFYLLKSDVQHGTLNIGSSIELKEFYKHIQAIVSTHNKNLILPDFLIFALNAMKIKKLESISNKVIYSDKKLLEFFKYPYGEFEGLKRTIENYKHLNLLA